MVGDMRKNYLETRYLTLSEAVLLGDWALVRNKATGMGVTRKLGFLA